MQIVGTLAVVLGLLAATPASAQIRQFRDWIAACDNARNCAAYAVTDELSIGYLLVTRGAAPAADPVVTLAINQRKRTTFRLAFDRPAGDILPTGTLVPENLDENAFMRVAIRAPIAAVVAALKTARKILITPVEPPEDFDYEVALTGALDALAWIDRQQKRAGTVTAIMARGPKPADATQAPDNIPTVVAARPDPTPPPAGHPPAILAKGRAACGKHERTPEPRHVHRLGPDLLMYWFFCPAYSGAYNLNQALLLVPDGDPARSRVVTLKYPPLVARIEKRREVDVYNADFDPATMTLRVFHRGRAASDCGTFSEWMWSGREFQLAFFSKLPVCGREVMVEDWPVLYRTKRAPVD